MKYPMLDDGTRDWCRTCTHDVNGACELMFDCTYQSDEKGLDYDKAPTKYKEKPMTNGDRIRSMSDEELADFITDDMCGLICGDPLACEGQCKQKMLDWLKEEEKG